MGIIDLDLVNVTLPPPSPGGDSVAARAAELRKGQVVEEAVMSSLATSFGVPQCVADLSARFLALLPGAILGALRNLLSTGSDRADATLKEILAWIRATTGLMEWMTLDGAFIFISKYAKTLDTLSAVEDLVSDVTAIVETGLQAYSNVKATIDDVTAIARCLKSWKELHKLTNRNANRNKSDILGTYNLYKKNLEPLTNFINKVDSLIADIDNEMAARANGSKEEPMFNPIYCELFAGTPLAENCPISLQTPKEIFRLTFGPPKSFEGKFILSVDGLYYDSQTNGLNMVLSHLSDKKSLLDKSDNWRLNQNPNLGGRGKEFTTNDLNLYLNTILDPSVIDESQFIEEYYTMDGFLQELINNKNKRIYDLSAQITDLVYENSAFSIISNFKQSLISENLSQQSNINKRKKQIEIAVKLPQIYGVDVLYSPGTVPVNDFSYLAGINISIDLEKQKSLIFSQTDISGVVLPLTTPKYVIPLKTTQAVQAYEHLIIPKGDLGAIIFDGSSAFRTNPVVYPATNSVTTDGLISMYNFIQTTIEPPSSTKFELRNSVSETNKKYAQLVGLNPESIFSRGLGVPYLHGIVKHLGEGVEAPLGVGSYIKLADTEDFNDLLYNTQGATVDFWIHTPNINILDGGYGTGAASGLFRLILANENTGITGNINLEPENNISNNFGSNVTRGFVMGFTKDRRITKNLSGSNDLIFDNKLEDSVFFIAPTQSTGNDSTQFISREKFDSSSYFTASGNSYHSMIQPIYSGLNSNSFSSCGEIFCHVAVTFDPIEDLIKFYLDGNLTTTSSMSYVFGIPKNTMPNLPSFSKSTSFRYSRTSVGPFASNDIKFGPLLNTYFTPWIIGGGYTDGLYAKGNFMGGNYGGVISGLKGYLGSLKFYKKALSLGEVLNNFKAQKDFFKNIDTLTEKWELVRNI